MSEFQNKRRQNFTIIANQALLDPTLSLRAKGLLCLMLSRPDNWTYRMDWICKQSKEGREATQAAIKELIGCDYVVRHAKRDLNTGKLEGWVYIVSDTRLMDEPSSGLTVERESRLTVFQVDSSNKENINTDFKKTETHVISEIQLEQEEILSVSAIATPDALVLEPSKPKPPKKNLTREMSLKFVAIWNDNCGNLPQVDKLNSSRETGFNTLFREYELDEAGTGSALVAAVRCVAADPFWNERKYGLDNLLRKGAVTAKAEKWRSSTTQTPSRREVELKTLAVRQTSNVTLGSRWLHPDTKLPLQVAEITSTTVFFEDGGPITEIWLSHMAGWKPIQGLGAVA